jgi:hypothetical protein
VNRPATFLCLYLVLASSDALASGSGILPPGDSLSAAKNGNGSRQIISLRVIGKLLVGAPVSSALSSITIRAHDTPPALRLILWERLEDDGARLLRLSAPPGFENGFMGATLFFRGTAEAGSLLQVQAGEWVALSREEIAIGEEVQPAKQDFLYAYPIQSLGLFLLRSESAAQSPITQPTDAGAFDIKIRLSRGFWHLYWPGILLAAVVILSRLHHRRG